MMISLRAVSRFARLRRMTSDLHTPSDSAGPASGVSNAAPYSVSELAGALKRTIEQAYDHVRLRGEISKITRHASGHVYLTLKDDRAAIDGVVWKGQVPRLQTQPESGLEVIVTGRITTFPASSKYQIVIEAMEVAGVGALLAQLERTKKRLHAEGLFAPERKRPLPFAPRTIGVITSPTGAVIRDILHRIRGRWPCHVIVWPVLVQGDQAASQVINALQGFQSGSVARPDVLIVARGGGSVEDLWPFNDEALARAVAACTIPVLSAVGHETDTTLIDYVSDRRAPTPTGAAEMATPVLSDLRALVADLERRRQTCFGQYMQSRRERVALLARALPRPQDLIDAAQQRLDFAGHRLGGGLMSNLNAHDTALTRIAARFRPGLLEHPRRLKTETLAGLSQRMDRAVRRSLALSQSHARLPDLGLRMTEAMGRMLRLRGDRLKALEQLRLSLDPDRPLNLGFARVNRHNGDLVTSPAEVDPGAALILTFKGRQTLDVIANGKTEGTRPPVARPAKAPSQPGPAPHKPVQGDLF
jgi:exodeoxyribonuclease VII large subunit